MPAYDNEGATISMEDVRGSDAPITISTIEEELAARRSRMLKPQKSTVASRKEQAVCVRRAHKRYGSSKMGRRRLNSGEIWVLGGKPGSPGSGVPGPRIGYMPQEVALFGEFSIRETLIYFGWIANMPTKENLSGGQQRRTSLAAALIHDPELLILDEPTIGLMRGGRFLAEESPSELLRRYHVSSLEDVFLKLSVMQNLGKRRRSSILADVVEKVELPAIPNPNAIDLEEAEIGEISGEFGDNVSMSSRGRVVVTPTVNLPVDSLPPDEKPKRGCMEIFMPMKWHHMKALIWKNFLSLFRNFAFLAFILGLPLTQMILFCLAIGHYPEGLPIAVVNYETNNTEPLCPYDRTWCPQNTETYEWNLTMFSCRYLDFLSKRQNNLLYYPDKDTAMYEARHGKARVVLVFPHNYSISLQERISDPRHADYYTVKNSDMEAHMDDTDKQVEWMLSRDLGLAFMESTEQLAEVCDLPKRIMSIPFNEPVYGLTVPNFTDFAGPGVILTHRDSILSRHSPNDRDDHPDHHGAHHRVHPLRADHERPSGLGHRTDGYHRPLWNDL
ncbi:Abc transporter, partial [Operophtera brumata]